jgi:ADP-heptose:LPS heptosyltransferase
MARVGLGKLMLAGLSRRLFRKRCARCDDLTHPERLLLVRIDERVGNLLTLQSLIDAFHQHLPHVRVSLLASQRVEPVTSQLQGLEQVHSVDKRWFLKKPKRWRSLIKKVRQVGYQVAVDASTWSVFSFTNAVLTWYSGAPVLIGYDRPGPLGFHTHRVATGSEQEHELTQRMRLLAPLGIEAKAPVLRTRMGLAQVETFRLWLKQAFGDPETKRPCLGIWAGSRKMDRRWPVPYYIQLAERLQKRANLVLLWGPGEQSVRDEILSSVSGHVMAAPDTDLNQLAGLLRNLDLLVTNDTGPMHLSVACKTPTVALFASGEPSRWGHPYPYTRNLKTRGKSEEEVGRAYQACVDLLGDHKRRAP